MDRKINLIPADMSVNSTTNKVKKVLNSLTMLSIGAFLVTIIAIAGFVYFFNRKITEIEATNSQLKTQIAALEGSEQRLVLAKDRLAKLQNIKSEDSAADELVLYQQITEGLDGEMSIAEVGLEATKIETSIATSQSQSLGGFFNKIITLPGLTKIVLSSLSFTPSSGYLAGLIFTTGGKE